jgi:hypothetical protein
MVVAVGAVLVTRFLFDRRLARGVPDEPQREHDRDLQDHEHEEEGPAHDMAMLPRTSGFQNLLGRLELEHVDPLGKPFGVPGLLELLEHDRALLAARVVLAALLLDLDLGRHWPRNVADSIRAP